MNAPAVSKLAVRDAEATKRRILEAATAEFAGHGYGGARVDQIASREGNVPAERGIGKPGTPDTWRELLSRSPS